MKDLEFHKALTILEWLDLMEQQVHPVPECGFSAMRVEKTGNPQGPDVFTDCNGRVINYG